MREHYILIKGEEVVDSDSSLKKIKEKFDKLPPKKKILDGRAIYKLVKEDK
jgi:hypothetical protein